MYRFYIIGLTVICLCDINYCFVLLTANLDDVKKLARQFVSESTADEIADFIAQITEMVINATAENGMNDKYDRELYTEETDKLRSVSRQRFKKVPNRSIKSRKDPKNHHKTDNDVSDRIKDVGNRLVAAMFSEKPKKNKLFTLKNLSKSKLQRKPHSRGKKASATKIDVEGREEIERNKQSNHLAKQYSYPLKEPRRPGYVLNDKSFQNQGIQKPHHTSTNRPTVEFTLGYAEKFLLDENHSSEQDTKKSKPDRNVFKLTANSGDVEEKNKESNNTNKIIDMFKSKFNELVNVQRATDLTTKKEKIEFDQYDNPNYQKRNFIATSGPVALPKLPVEKPEKPWWNRSMPKETQKNKEWF